MSALLKEAMDFYRAGNHVMVMNKLGPLIEDRKNVEPALALMMAQSCVKLQQYARAAHWYDRACVPALPNLRQVQLLAAKLYVRIGNWQRAYEITESLLKTDPKDFEALNTHRNALRMLLKFDEAAASDRQVAAWMEAGEPGIFDMENPLDHLFWSDEDRFAARLTRIDGGSSFNPLNRLMRRTRPHEYGHRIRVGYLSNDLGDRHATMILVQAVLAGHDPAGFETHVFCYTDDALRAADSGGRSRLPNLHDVREMPDAAVIDLIREMKIDILVDLKGHTRDARPGILNGGAAPVQVAWLGFPGINTGIDCDYMIGDRFVTPPESQPFWDAAFCRLPESYQPNDGLNRVLPPATDRAALGLPADKVIFASFNNQRKISPKTFRLWMEVLAGAPNSVLWMAVEGEDARANMRAAMASRGVDPERVLFADILPYAAHIARLRAADLGIDTFPCNGHTTTSDKLWAGLPLVTLKGRNFAGRVSESLLNAMNLSELVVGAEADYVGLNIRLATDEAYRRDVASRLDAARGSAPLFDTERFTRHLEDAYRLMIERARTGRPPEAFDVPPRAPRIAPFRP